ncbi:MAG: hypothetical protein PUE38_02970, partial [Olsenella sp.]|nr:hypothetical protein [Olsenella sp.]
MLRAGLYEQTVSEGLRRRIAEASVTLEPTTREIDAAEASRVLADYVASVARAELARVGEGEKDALAAEVALANRMIDALATSPGSDAGARVDASARQLLSLVPRGGLAGVLPLAGAPAPGAGLGADPAPGAADPAPGAAAPATAPPPRIPPHPRPHTPQSPSPRITRARTEPPRGT